MSELVNKLFAIHDSLTKSGIRHAFGGAIALAYCTQEPRGTRDLDINIFVDGATESKKALLALPKHIALREADYQAAKNEGQVRLWWQDVPVDVFFNTHPFHNTVAEDVQWVPLSGREIPVLGSTSLVVFKALFDRTKDWADIEAIAEVSLESIERATVLIEELFGENISACKRLTRVLRNYRQLS